MKKQTQALDSINLQKKIAEIYAGIKPAPDDDDNSPWSAIIQAAQERTIGRISKLEFFARFHPYMWELIGDYGLRFGEPKPIPWFFAHELATVIVERVRLISDISEGMQKGSAVKTAGNFIIQFTDSICPDPPKIKIPKRWPPEPDPDPRWSALELAAIAEVFVTESLQSHLKSSYQAAASKIIDVASGRV